MAGEADPLVCTSELEGVPSVVGEADPLVFASEFDRVYQAKRTLWCVYL